MLNVTHMVVGLAQKILLSLFTLAMLFSVEGNASDLSFELPNGDTIQIPNHKYDEEQLEAIKADLSSHEYFEFERRRLEFLKHAAQVFWKLRWGSAPSYFIKKQIAPIFRRDQPISILNPSPEIIDFAERQNSNFAEFSRQSIIDMLEVINDEFWLHAPIVAHSNEYGVLLTIAPNGGAAFGAKGDYRAAGVGISISVNRITRDMSVEVVTDLEKHYMGIPGQVNLGVMLKVSAFIANRKAEVKPYQYAHASYPLGPFSLEDSSSHFAIGVPLQIGLIPSPFDSAMGIHNHLKRKVIYRASIEGPVNLGRKFSSWCRNLMGF